MKISCAMRIPRVAVPNANGVLSFSPAAPRGATHGLRSRLIEPQRDSGLRVVWRSRSGCQNPFRVQDFLCAVSQGSSFLATLGWRTESLWDSLLAEFWKLEKEAEKMLEGLANQ
ncbi:MAG: hypothetical protein ABI651_11860 [Verrucomicrobiota bacterium]